MKPRLVDLCAGTGCFSKAFDFAEVVYANDLETSSKTFYDHNFPHKLTLGDINLIDPTTVPEHDILTAGFPCQPFSIAGKRLGFDDLRSNVFASILRILELRKPRCFVLENVKNLKTHNKGETMSFITTSLEDLGYRLHIQVLNTCVATEIPQNRERIYIVGFKNEKDFTHFELPIPTPVRRNVVDYLDKEVSDKYYYNDSLKVYPLVLEKVITPGVIYQYRRTLVRENASGVCPTLTANMGSGGHNVPLILDHRGIRKLTPKECFSLQGMSEFQMPPLSDAKLYKLAGNAVSLPVVRLISNAIKKVISPRIKLRLSARQP